jgi:peptidyl-prolyl cis-trans isomerase C
MSRFTARILAAAIGLSATAGVFAQNIAVVNGRPVPKARADFFVAEQTKQGQQDTPELQKMVREELINREILQQEAERKGLGSTAEVKQQLELTKQAILLRALQEDFMKTNKLSDEELANEYNKIKAQFGDKEYRARHILVDTEDKAKALIEQIKKGAKFEDIAKANSKDPGSGQNGGDLDYAAPGNFVPEFSQAMTGLQKGQMTETPVKTQFGYHIIKLEDIREAQVPSLAEVKPQLSQSLLAKKWTTYQQTLKSKAVIK